jgi:osmotically inducible protein OsmC
MPTRNATAVWKGTLQEGTGSVSYGSYENPYSFNSRFEDGQGTNPEELLAAAHAGCYSMALNAALHRGGFTPVSVSTTAKAHLNKGEAGFSINQIDLEVEAEIPGITDAQFQEMAEATKTGCIISKALASVPMTLKATLI